MALKIQDFAPQGSVIESAPLVASLDRKYSLFVKLSLSQVMSLRDVLLLNRCVYLSY